MQKKTQISALLSALALSGLAACGQDKAADAAPSTEPADAQTAEKSAAMSSEDSLAAVLASDHRSEEERARDAYRHPSETLLFFGVTPEMSVVEVSPGGGWYTKIIAPYLKSGGGAYYAANFDPASSDYAARSVTAFKENYMSAPETYGDVNLTVLGGEAGIAPAGTADAVLTFRNVHNWTGRGVAGDYFAQFYDALKPGGVLGVVEHRADTPEGEGDSGYVTEATVIALAEAAGFELDARSEINANAADTKDHPFGVWTLPPVRRSSAVRGQEDPDFDRAKYDAIGESDRMTLKFRKPIAADGALLE